jgi:glycosyltransferase involved in cell wall biosynthesis
MRVLWLLKNFGMGGAERVLLELSPHMGSTEFVAVAVHLGGGEMLRPLEEAGVAPRVLVQSPLDPRWVSRLRHVARRERVDLIHAHLPVPGTGARLAGLGSGIPIVYTEHSTWEAFHPLTRWANALTYGLNDAVIAVSQTVEQSIIRSRLGRRQLDRITTIMNGIDAAQVVADGNHPVADVPAGSYGSVIGWVRPDKGADVLIEAAASIRREFPDRTCVLIGEGGVASVRQQARSLGLQTVVSFLGRRMDARAVMAHLEVVVIPSRREGLPLVLLEAMALGRPVVAAAVGGIPEVIRDGVNGLLVPPEDPAAIAEAVARLLRDPALRARLGGSAAEAVEGKWNVRTTARSYDLLYRQVLGLEKDGGVRHARPHHLSS